MAKRIFWSIFLVAALGVGVCLGVLYGPGSALGSELVAAAAISLALAGGLGFWLSRKLVEPLDRLDDGVYPELRPMAQRLRYQQDQMLAQSRRLRHRQEEFDTVTRSMQEGLVLLGRELEILSINPAARRLFGGGELETGGRVRPLLEDALAGRRGQMTLAGEDRLHELDASPVLTDSQVTGVVLLSFDVTDRERSEALRQAFTANVSHELKTPLHAISGYAEVMAAGIAKPEDTPEFAGRIHREARRLVELVEDILKLSQLDEGGKGMQWEDCDLFALAQQEAERLQPIADSAQVSLHIVGRGARVRGVAQLLTGIVHNLCDNAIKYNVPGGRVEIQVVPEENEAVLTVTDTGIGIPAEDQERIFERFYRVDKSRSKAVGGTGLGLSIVKHAARIHGARISLASDLGKGTRVQVRIPSEDGR